MKAGAIPRAERRRIERNGQQPVMSLNVRERILLLGVLPKIGDIVTLKIVRDLQDDLSLSEEEIKKGKVVQKANGVAMGLEAQTILKDISVGEKGGEIIRGALKERSDKKQLPLECLEIYELFMETPAGEPAAKD